jgi:hypothetical protein
MKKMILTAALSLIMTAAAMSRAIKLRKKLFCMVGISPAMRIKTFMPAKQRAEVMISKMPLYFGLIFITGTPEKWNF